MTVRKRKHKIRHLQITHIINKHLKNFLINLLLAHSLTTTEDLLCVAPNELHIIAAAKI